MRNLQVAAAFLEMAELLELSGETGFKPVAYRRAARTLEHLAEDIEQVYEEGRLLEVPGIGKGLAGKVGELLTRGTFHQLEELRRQVPRGLVELLAVPGLGPRTAAVIYRHLGIAGLGELERAAGEGRLRGLPGLGEKKEANIRESIRRLAQRLERAPLAEVLPLAQELRAALAAHPVAVRVEIAGSIRRGRETVKDIDLVAASARPEELMDHFATLPQVAEVIARGETKATVRTYAGGQADLRVVAPEHFAAAWHHFTGSAEHHVRLRHRARERGSVLNEYGAFADEAGLYESLGLPFIPPELREDAGEVEAAEAGRLPELIRREDLRGDLHLHTRWSDGLATVAEMAAQARKLGHEYIAVADHSPSLVVAHGLDARALAAQRAEIEEINGQAGDFKVFRGVEVDILKDGSLDLPDEVLRELDVVTASVHTRLGGDAGTMTKRLELAMKNPHVDAIGHPTGRLLGRRDPYPLDLERVLEVAAETGTALELNASPYRLDLGWVGLKRARESGVKVVINSDAHSTAGMADLAWGINEGRRGWLEAPDVLNTRPREDLERFLMRKR